MSSDLFIHILILAAIVAFLIHRLHGVLGKRHGEERQRPNPFAPGSGGDKGPAGEPSRPGAESGESGAAETPSPQTPVADGMSGRVLPGLERIRQRDPDFDSAAFLEGAGKAFEMIVDAFARGDRTALADLLGAELYDTFEAAIAEREQQGQTLETEIDRIARLEIVDAGLDGNMARVTVRIVSEQNNVLRDSRGRILEGDPASIDRRVDIWTFARDTHSHDPNWSLVETRSETDERA